MKQLEYTNMLMTYLINMLKPIYNKAF